MAKRKRYSDKFRASAVVMLEGAGYPDEKGALTRISEHLSVPQATLHRWFHEKQNPPPSELVNEKKDELANLLDAEIRNALMEMNTARETATYRDLGTVLGILVDKKQLITGKPTSRSESTGKDGGPIELRHTLLSELSDEELDRIIASESARS